MSKATYGKIDYSKWDKLEVSSDEEPQKYKAAKPRVTKLDQGSSVTIERTSDNKDGPELTINKERDCQRILPDVGGVGKSGITQQSAVADSCEDKCHNGGKHYFDVEEWSKKGGVLREYIWRQDRYSVDAAIFLPQEARGKDITVKLRNEGTGVEVGWREGIVLSGDFSFAVEEDEDKWLWEVVHFDINKDAWTGVRVSDVSRAAKSAIYEDESLFPFSVEGDSAKVCVLFLFTKKKESIPGLTIWWKSLLKGDPESKKAAGVSRSLSDMKNAKIVQESWEKAHDIFQQKAKAREKILVDFDSGDEVEGKETVPTVKL